MAEADTTPAPGRLPANIMHFARLLRRAGLPVGPSDMLAAQHAVQLVDIGSRAQVRTALRTTMVHRHEHEDLFDQAFRRFWRDPTRREGGRGARTARRREGKKAGKGAARQPPAGGGDAPRREQPPSARRSERDRGG